MRRGTLANQWREGVVVQREWMRDRWRFGGVEWRKWWNQRVGVVGLRLEGRRRFWRRLGFFPKEREGVR